MPYLEGPKVFFLASVAVAPLVGKIINVLALKKGSNSF